MSLPRTPTISGAPAVPSDQSSLEPVLIAPSFCQTCNETMFEGEDCIIINVCSHQFHRACIEPCLADSSECPICHRSCELNDIRQVIIVSKESLPSKVKGKSNRGRGALAKSFSTRNTRRNPLNFSFNANMNTETAPAGPIASVAPDDNGEDGFNSEPIVNHISIDYGEINKMIELNVTRVLQNMNIVQADTRDMPRNVLSNQYSDVRASDKVLNAANRQSSPAGLDVNNVSRPSISGSNSTIAPSDKITSIIQNWNLKFDGSSAGLNVDEFLYRVRSLTKDNFNNDFTVICKNLHILLIGKAREWFWRYHKRVVSVEWDDFCLAIRNQYKELKSPFDIKEEVRCRKQRPGEVFDVFLDAVTTIMDRLPDPIPDEELVEILIRNLRPDIRQDLLYVQISSLSHLRRLVQRRENFLNDEHVKRNLAWRNATAPQPSRRNIAEIEIGENEVSGSDREPDQFVDALQKSAVSFSCWNCDGIGHHWQDCVEDRRIFCYGCGLKDTYKPNCSRCSSKKSSFPKNFRAQVLPKDQV